MSCDSFSYIGIAHLATALTSVQSETLNSKQTKGRETRLSGCESLSRPVSTCSLKPCKLSKPHYLVRSTVSQHAVCNTRGTTQKYFKITFKLVVSLLSQ